MEKLRKSLTKKQYEVGMKLCCNMENEDDDYESSVPSLRHGKPNILHIAREWRISGIHGKDEITVSPDGSWRYLT